MSKLAFLSNIQVVAEDKPRSTGTSRKEWNPASGLTIRVWKDGSVFPSEDLMKKFDLEYRTKLSDEELKALKEASKLRPFPGNGFDVADTEDFPSFQTGGQRFLVISPAEKDAGKVDLFYSTNYTDDGTPKTSVMDQGATTFGKEFLIPRVEEVYGIVFAKPGKPAVEAVSEQSDAESGKIIPGTPAQPEVPAIEGVEFVDLVFLGQSGENSDPWTLPNGKTVAFFPKSVSRGDNKGQMTTARRENPQMYILYPKQLIDQEETAAQ